MPPSEWRRPPQNLLDSQMAEARDYRHRLVEAGEEKAAVYIYMILKQLEGETTPAENLFLQALCFVSLREAMRVLAERDPADAGEENANDARVES